MQGPCIHVAHIGDAGQHECSYFKELRHYPQQKACLSCKSEPILPRYVACLRLFNVDARQRRGHLPLWHLLAVLSDIFGVCNAGCLVASWSRHDSRVLHGTEELEPVTPHTLPCTCFWDFPEPGVSRAPKRPSEHEARTERAQCKRRPGPQAKQSRRTPAARGGRK